MNRHNKICLWAWCGWLLCTSASWGAGQGTDIRWTADGMPHVRADNWHDLGRGVGYVQAKDALCTLAEAFVTFNGQRTPYFGPEARPKVGSTFGTSANLDLDIFFRAFVDDAQVASYRASQPQALDDLVQGFADGYNAYLSQVRLPYPPREGHRAKHACLKAPWVHAITAQDVYRRMVATNLAAGYMRFIPEIVHAAPPVGQPESKVAATDMRDLRAKLSHPIGDQPGLGSNMMAFGRLATGQQEAVLLGNPHWYWAGPDRYFQMHLTIPGQIDVAGVGFLGVPLVMIGFNDNVAWSHTVSQARRFGLFDIQLDPADPTHYTVDGVTEAMRHQTVSVDWRDAQGRPHTESRTLYSTRYGPLIDLDQHHPDLGWGRSHAVAIRDINTGNARLFRNFLRWGQARSLDEFIAIQREEAAMPWVNTVAIGRGDGRVWYADMGAVPNVPDALRQTCATPMSTLFATVDPFVPVLDGSRSACNWVDAPSAAQPGALPASAMPSLLREDHVANMNDSHWLANPAEPLEGYPLIMGSERQALSLRARLGHKMAQALAANPEPASASALAQHLMTQALNPRAYSAELFKDALLDQACAGRWAVLNQAPIRIVDVRQACAILRAWPNTANAPDKGALLWEAYWHELGAIPSDAFYGVPFSSAEPLDTPRVPMASDPRVTQALARAVQTFVQKGWPLDASVGARRFVRSEGRAWPLYGGCQDVGYFVIACRDDESSDTGGPDDRDESLGIHVLANSFMQVVWFGPDGVHATTMLAHGQRETAIDGGAGAAPVRRYARKDWLRFPFHERDIERDPALRRVVLRP